MARNGWAAAGVVLWVCQTASVRGAWGAEQGDLKPIARWDMVPMERVEGKEPFQAGVVAFSKAGIEKVRFVVFGAGYSGPSPVDVREMTFNARTQVWEYWLGVKAGDFAEAGKVTLTATVHGQDGGVRELGEMQVMVDPKGVLPRPETWVAVQGKDAEGVVGDRAHPFGTIDGAAKALAAWMKGKGLGTKCDGGMIRLLPGEHAASGSEIPAEDWVTIACDPAGGGTRENTILQSGSGAINGLWVKVQGLTLKSLGNAKYLFNLAGTDPLIKKKSLWLDDCRLLGAGRYLQLPEPIGNNWRNKYFTGCYAYDVRRGIGGSAQLVRNMKMEKLGDDAFQNCPLAINVESSDLDPGEPGGPEWHADAWQVWGPSIENAIVYNYRATDLHYQGIWARIAGPARNVALVNCLFELRKPIREYGPGNRGGGSGFQGDWDHLVFWHNTLLNHPVSFYRERTSKLFGFRNCSFIGNVFHEWRTDEGGGPGKEAAWTLPENPQNNEFLHNHYTLSRADGQTNAHVHSKSPDSGKTQTVGDPGLSLDPDSERFAWPQRGSALLNRSDRRLVPADVFGNPRDARPDAGAVESGGRATRIPGIPCGARAEGRAP